MNKKVFTGYQVFVIGVLAFLQFTVMLDFMILSPLGAVLMDELHVSTAKFGLVVAAYAFSAGISGILAAGFADRFDRKRLLLFFYAGFVLGTILCGIAPTYEFLLIARIVTGLFGGVIGSISFAIIADLFAYEVRGRVMGIIMTAFAASQVLGIPIGLFLSNHFGWHAPFLMIAGLSVPAGILIAYKLQPITDHIGEMADRHALKHLFATVTQTRYLSAFAATALLATGGFMLMPFGSAFSVHNLGISLEDLPVIYAATGLTSIVAGPLMGKISDAIGKYKIFFAGSIVALSVILYYTQMEITPIWVVILISALLFAAISARMISASALTSAVPEMKDRGAFMSVNSSLQQVSGGIASMLAGLIVVQTPAGRLDHYDRLGYVVAGAITVTIFLMHRLNRHNEEHAKAKENMGEKSIPRTVTTE